jgi:hypothetical protein
MYIQQFPGEAKLVKFCQRKKLGHKRSLQLCSIEDNYSLQQTNFADIEVIQ